MEVAELTKNCQTKFFKDILRDLMFSFRQSVWKLTNTNIDIKLSKIRITPIIHNGTQIDARVINLVGGRITCILDNRFVSFIENTVDYENPLHIFMEDVFDLVSHSSNSILELNLEDDLMDWKNNLYFIQYNIRIRDGENSFNTTLTVGVDEMTTLYFTN